MTNQLLLLLLPFQDPARLYRDHVTSAEPSATATPFSFMALLHPLETIQHQNRIHFHMPIFKALELLQGELVVFERVHSSLKFHNIVLEIGSLTRKTILSTDYTDI
jgi:hypothetical protein